MFNYLRERHVIQQFESNPNLIFSTHRLTSLNVPPFCSGFLRSYRHLWLGPAEKEFKYKITQLPYNQAPLSFERF